MPTLYVTTPSVACWHILRPNERQLVWCQTNRDGPAWTQLTLHTPAAVCSACMKAETVSRALDAGRDPALAGVV
jgi:hypothetical protein